MAAEAKGKSDQAFRTIGELAAELGVPQHILRYWETRFEQLRPLQRAGNRRYYRPADVALARRIHRLLDEEGYTIRGVQQLLAAKGSESEAPASAAPAPPPQVEMNRAADGAVSIDDLRALRRTLAEALALSA
jgi:DNA-binding transcriptional MerR regulator